MNQTSSCVLLGVHSARQIVAALVANTAEDHVSLEVLNLILYRAFYTVAARSRIADSIV